MSDSSSFVRQLRGRLSTASRRVISPSEPHGLFAGPVEGLDAHVAFVVGSGGALAHVCDGTSVSEWTGGRIREGRLVIVSRQGIRLEAELRRRVVRGTLTLPDDARARAFTAGPARGAFRTACLPVGTEGRDHAGGTD